MSARDDLDRALAGMADRGRRPRCAEYPDASPWLSDDKDERATAASWCTGCPVLTQCAAAAAEAGEKFGVWGGKDLTRMGRPTKKESSNDR